MELDATLDLINKLKASLEEHRRLVETPNITSAERSVIALALSDTCFMFGEAFGGQQKVHTANALEALLRT